MDRVRLNVPLLRKRVPNLTAASRSVGLRPATVSNLCTGKIPIERAEVRTLIALATLAECSLDDLILKGYGGEMIETGIKVVDFFAPLVSGGINGFVARPGMGQLVLLAEIFKRLTDKEYKTVFLLSPNADPGVSDVIEVASTVCNNVEEVYNHILKIGKNHEVALAADRSLVLNGELYTLHNQLEKKGIQPITTFLVDPRGDAVDEEEPYGPLESLWQFDADLASRRMYPAVNPIQSTSVIIENSQLEPIHNLLLQRARKLLRRYRELRFLVNAVGFEKLPSLDKQVYLRGERIEAYLTQPFFVAESFTNKPGQYVNLHDTIRDIQQIIDGALDEIEVKEFSYIGKLHL
ncbi:hypothetical protein IMZ08_13095 [Bacillus luteolus]|uniref:ATP synthase A/B type C-terminal domain-containing protein n=1 Tax=Litchfieldia luteola TaxID=682179 RepID=A0ABR9QLC3_9BACI|nr:hypothetical protein [Cytobacillus luteolus]MBE4908999.1 hypothetical protein [Cytobacillus luteolus]MBP1941858.1 F-type H+-transporting ATPase subunit beta [Cytobacillus luteolus]